MTENEAVARVLQIARQEIGYREKTSGSGLDDQIANAGSGNYTKYARDLDRIPGFYNGPKQGFAWCDVFYDWLIVAAFGPEKAKELLCQPSDSAGAGCYYSALYYRTAGRFFAKDPHPGDQIFFTYQTGEVSHTGIVEMVNGESVVTIEGNTSDQVARRTYPFNSGQIYGYGRPDWSLVSASSPETDAGQGEADPGADQQADPDPVVVETYTITLPTLSEGAEGLVVERVQTLLIARGYYCGGRVFFGRERADGEFGPATTVAVKDLQSSCGLQPDGIIEAKTMTALLTM